jgi:hypothetical protein
MKQADRQCYHRPYRPDFYKECDAGLIPSFSFSTSVV